MLTLRKRSRKQFQTNLYTVTNIGDVWEADLADVRTLNKHDGFKYLLTVIDVFCKNAHSILLARSRVGVRHHARQDKMQARLGSY
jgi:hypothetical protein